ncbi:pre-RNA processing PIH1/Nop17-domain-containing protein [Mycena alexandri]|uniref:Pre-RNA processing PIH1/Nop17-domain-containing protein n=1 Tax=Mycena alexandri TaxID=1745969 RepID=A0AAD6X957_9AGAR|nr:pre-RNA processing PIH1/Nop17-domain-containing protein [Mycena alexandri]
MSKVSVSLKPSAGFCIKTTLVKSAILQPQSSVPPGPNSLEPPNPSIAVPANRKIFINFAWDAQVPPPPEGNEEAIQRAMHGEDEHLNPDAWFVPVIVSEPRQDTDKSGNPSLVFDCIFHSSIRSRTVRDPAFKIFIQELGLQRIEAQTSLVLSRQISTPNIASKGKLQPRTAHIPASLSTVTAAKAPLIEEIENIISPSVTAGALNDNKSEPQAAKGKGILKPTAVPAASQPTWSWSKTPAGAIEITISIPSLTRALIPQTALDLEAKRIVLTVPAHPPLDIDFGVSDAEIVAMSGGNGSTDSGHAALMLKRERALDVDGATAEWRVADSLLVLTV